MERLNVHLTYMTGAQYQRKGYTNTPHSNLPVDFKEAIQQSQGVELPISRLGGPAILTTQGETG